MPIYHIPAENMHALEAQLERLNRRADKLGVSRAQLRIIESVDTLAANGIDVYTVHTVELIGEAPKYNGWSFVGTIQFVDGQVILRAIPGQTLPEQYRAAVNYCDQCKTSRRRANTYLVKNESGEYKQVGSDCLRDFLGHSDPQSLAAIAEMLISLTELAEDNEWNGEGGAGGSKRVNLDSYLALAASAIRVDGWMSKAKALEFSRESTTDRIERSLRNYKIGDKLTVIDVDVELAAKARQWARDLGTSGKNLSDYEWNLVIVAGMNAIKTSLCGIAASMISAYRRENERVENNKRDNSKAVSAGHFGTIGKREQFTLTVSDVKRLPDSQFGESWLISFENCQGARAVWFTSKNPNWEKGQTYTLKATVKAHQEYNGIPQTGLTRVALA